MSDNISNFRWINCPSTYGGGFFVKSPPQALMPLPMRGNSPININRLADNCKKMTINYSHHKITYTEKVFSHSEVIWSVALDKVNHVRHYKSGHVVDLFLNRTSSSKCSQREKSNYEVDGDHLRSSINLLDMYIALTWWKTQKDFTFISFQGTNIIWLYLNSQTHSRRWRTMRNNTLEQLLNATLNLTEDLAKTHGSAPVVPFSWKLISSIILATGCIGNILTIFSIFSDKHLKTPTYLLIACMAIADLCAIVVRFIILTWNVFLPDVLPSPVEFELISAGVGMVVVQSSCLHVVLFAYVRYALLVHPLWSRFSITSERVVYASVAVWALSFFLGILYGMCGLFITEEFDILVLEIVYISYLIAATMIPIALLHVLKIHRLKKSRTHECTQITKRMTLISGIVIFVQIITMVPIAVKVIILLFQGFVPNTSDVTDLIVHLMLSVGNSINPVIYFLMSNPQKRHWSKFHLCFS